MLRRDPADGVQDGAPLAKAKRWYNSDVDSSLKLIAQPDPDEYETMASARWKHPRVMPGFVESLVYPITDGPGIALLVLLPPILWMLTLPIFDLIAVMSPIDKGHWALGLMVVPVMTPMMFSLAMTLGYALLFLGHMLVSSSLGENDHPRWPEWHPSDIAEGVCRWFWAGLFGLFIGGAPVALYLVRRRPPLEWLDWLVLAELAIVGGGYSLTALAASLLHENIIAANPVTVISSIARIGWGFLKPSIAAGITLATFGVGIWDLLYNMPSMRMEALGLWIFWVIILYQAMVVMRMMGLSYHAHALELHWFRRRPRWVGSNRPGRIYVNS